MGPGNVIQEDGLTVEVKVPRLLEERIQWHFGDGTGRFRHPRGHVFVCDDCGRIPVDGHARLGDGLVAARVIRVRVGVDHPANRLRGQLPDRRKNLVAHRRDTGIHHQDPLIAGLHRNVASRPNEHVDVPLDVERLDFIGRRLALQKQGRADERQEHQYYGGTRAKARDYIPTETFEHSCSRGL